MLRGKEMICVELDSAPVAMALSVFFADWFARVGVGTTNTVSSRFNELPEVIAVR